MTERLESVIGELLDASPGGRCFWWNGTWYDHVSLREMADDCERVLRESGFSPGQRLAVLMPNTPSFLALTIAVWRMGGAICPLNVRSGVVPLTATLSLLEPFAVIVSDEIRNENGTLFGAGGWVHSVCPPMGAPAAFQGQATGAEDRDLAVIFSTSGTTGAPKAVPVTHANLLDNCRNSVKALEDLKEGDALLNALPNFHAFGFMTGYILPLILKGSQVIVPGFMPPAHVVRAVLEAPANVLILVPVMLGLLLATLEKSGTRISTVTLVVVGGDRYNVRMDARAQELLGLGVVEGYGLTECSPVVAFNRSLARRRLGTVGQFLDGYEFRLREEDGTPAKGDEGVLWVRGPSVVKGYFRVAEADRRRFDDGWFNTGDYVRIESGAEGNFIRILERVTDIIIVSGFNVYPQEVEGMLRTHPAVQDAVVTGMASPAGGELPKAWIVKKTGIDVTEAEIIRFCKKQLEHYKVPRRVVFIDKLPVSATGKTLRRKLKEMDRETDQENGQEKDRAEV